MSRMPRVVGPRSLGQARSSSRDGLFVDPITRIDFRPDGSQLAVVNYFDDSVTVLDLISRREIYTIRPSLPNDRRLAGLTFYDDGEVELIMPKKESELDESSRAVLLQTWDSTGRSITSQFEAPNFILGTADSSTRTRVFLGFDNVLRYWDKSRSVNTLTLSVDTSTRHAASEVALSGDGNTVAFTTYVPGDSNAASLFVVDMNPASIVRRICDAAGRGLTKEEWESYLGTAVEYRNVCS
jgi:WD40 repeat protein